MKKLLLFAVAVLLIGIQAIAQDTGKKEAPRKRPLILAQLTDPQIGFGDWDDELERFRQEITYLNVSDCQAVVICGDMMHFTSRKNMKIFQQELSRLKRPVFLVPGNHDVVQMAHSRAQWLEMFGPAYYAADIPRSDYRLVVLDTELWQHPTDETAKMDALFLEELEKARKTGKRLVLAAHAPIFVDSLDEPERYYNLPKERRKWVLDHLVGSPVAAYLTGHTHTSFAFVWKGILFSSGDNTSVTFDNLGHGLRKIVFNGEWIRFHTIPIEKTISATIPFLADEPRLDGILDEDFWKEAAEFVLVRNDGKLPPENYRTTLRVGWTKDALVVGAVCRAPKPLETTSSIGPRDDIKIFEAADVLEFFLANADWSAYRHLALDFEGHFWDTTGKKAEQAGSWNPNWKFAISRPNDSSWTAEVVIPLKELWGETDKNCVKPRKDLEWRVNFCRKQSKVTPVLHSWSPPGFHKMHVFGKLVFKDGND